MGFRASFLDDDSETGVLYQEEHSGGPVKISVDKILLDGKLDELAYDRKSYHQAIAEWEVGDGAKAVKPTGKKAFDEKVITVVRQCKLSAYFTPDWDSILWSGDPKKKGAFVKGDDGIYKFQVVTLKDSIIISLQPRNEGVAVTTKDHLAIRLVKQAPVDLRERRHRHPRRPDPVFAVAKSVPLKGRFWMVIRITKCVRWRKNRRCFS